MNIEGIPKATNLDPETIEIIKKLSSLNKAPQESKKDISVKVRPPTDTFVPKKNGGWSSFAERSLPNGDRE